MFRIVAGVFLILIGLLLAGISLFFGWMRGFAIPADQTSILIMSICGGVIGLGLAAWGLLRFRRM